MRKVCITAAAALMLTGCKAADVPEKVSETVTVTQATESIVTAEQDTFFGVLMDECCSDIEDPALHETNCMFMVGCRESGYGLDIEQPDGSWVFYKFDDEGQWLTWEYLNTTERQDGLYVTVTGILENDTIKVIAIEES